jgi:hypothetical protein
MRYPTGISSAWRLPWLFSLAMDLKEEKERNYYGILESRKAMRE